MVIRCAFVFVCYKLVEKVHFIPVASWTTKIPYCAPALERTWLHHEIGRCHLEIRNSSEAKQHGQKSSQAAEEAMGDMWRVDAKFDIEVQLISLEFGMCLSKTLPKRQIWYLISVSRLCAVLHK